jgi:ribonucleoside-diphosphate reductase alpha chain
MQENIEQTSRTYTKEEVFAATREYFNDELAANVFIDKYALRNENNELLELTPTDMHWRLANEFSRIQQNKYVNTDIKPLSAQQIFDLFDHFKFVCPQGSPMYGIGNNYTFQSLGNCFTLGEHPYDSYGGICYADQMLVQLSKRRCGVGVCLDNLRPKGMSTKNAAKTTDGIEVFIQRYSNSMREVAQNGRRGAALIGLSVHHPQIEDFINIKRDKKKVTGANLSVIISDEFMKAVKNNTEYEQRWPIESSTPQITKRVLAKDIWDKIIDAAWECAEPGLLFRDTAREYGLSHQYAVKDSRFADIVTNPCGEIWEGMDACRLMVLNLFSYVLNPFTDKAKFNYKLFSEHTQIAQRLMDDMIDLEEEKINSIIQKVENDPEPAYIKQIEIEMWKSFLETMKLGRRTGLGLTGLADTLAALNIKYGTQESIDKTRKLYKTFAIQSMKASCLMAKDLGVFPLYDKELEKNNLFLKNLFKYDEELKELHNKYGRRHISLTTSSPFGTGAILTRGSSSIEPVFLLEYSRRRKVGKDDKTKKVSFVDKTGDSWEEYTIKHYGLELWSKITGKTDVKESPYYGATANDIDWLASVKIQAAAQEFLTHSVSKTCNIPNNATKELVSQIYMEAYEQKCKGFTVYRDGCRDGVLISKEKDKKSDKRPRELPCEVHHVTVKGNKYLVMIGLENCRPYEVFSCKNGKFSPNIKSGKIIRTKKDFYKAEFEDGTELSPITISTTDLEDAITRLTSALLRSNADINTIVTQLEKVEGDVHCYAKAIARALKHHVKDGDKIEGENCPECGAQVVRRDGCWGCSVCFWQKC